MIQHKIEILPTCAQYTVWFDTLPRASITAACYLDDPKPYILNIDMVGVLQRDCQRLLSALDELIDSTRFGD